MRRAQPGELEKTDRDGTGRAEDRFSLRSTHLLVQNIHQSLRSEEHTSELQSLRHLVCRLLLEKNKVGFLLRSLIMFQTFISRHNSNFFSDKLVLTSVTPASSAPVLQTPKATSSTLYFDSLTVNAGNGGFLHCIQRDTSVNAANQVVSVGADIAFFFFPNLSASVIYTLSLHDALPI